MTFSRRSFLRGVLATTAVVTTIKLPLEPLLRQPAVREMPAGAIVLHTGDVAPDGFLPCDGRVISRTAFSDLYAVIEDTYGLVGLDGFRLPDLQPLGHVADNTITGIAKPFRYLIQA